MAVADYTGPTCPTACGVVTVPAVDIADCVDSIQEELSEITDVYVVGVDANGDPLAAPADWEVAGVGGWADELDQAVADKIRHLIVSGDKPDTENTDITFSKFRIKTVNRRHTLSFDVDDVSDLNYTFMLSMQCGATVRLWYATYGGKLYGGPTGILADIRANYALERGQDSRALIKFIATWDRKFDPPRIDNPLI